MQSETTYPSAVAAPAPAPARHWPLFVLAFGSLLVTGIFQSVVPQEQTSIFNEFGLNELKFGIVAASIALLSSLLGITAAYLAPRLGLAKVCLFGFVLFVLGLAGIVYVRVAVVALAFGLVTAWGMAYLHLANGVAVQLDPKRGAHLTNLLHGTSALGKAIGPTFAMIGVSWREPFVGVAALAAGVGLVGAFGRRGAVAAESGDPAEAEEAPARVAFRQPFFWACAALFFPIVGMEQVVNVWLPRYLQKQAGFGIAEGERIALVAASVILWTQCGCRFLAPVLLTRVRPLPLLLCCALATGGILVGTELSLWSGWGGTVGLILCGIAFSTPYPTFFAIACRYFPRHKGLLSVMSGAATSFAFIVFSGLGGVVGYYAGLEWALRLSPVLGAMLFLGAVLIYWRGEKRTNPKAG